MKLRTKILLSYGVILLVVVIVSSWSLFNLRNLGQATEAMWQQNYRSILAAEKMMEAIERQDRAALLLILGREKEAPGQFHEYEITFLQWLARAKDNLTMYGFKKLIDYNNRLFIPLKTALSSYSNPI